MKNYEITILILPEVNQSDLKNISEKICDFILKEKGEIKTKSEPEIRNLGYPVKNKEKAFLISIVFEINPTKIENLKKMLREEKEIIRYIISHIRERKESQKPPRKKIAKPTIKGTKFPVSQKAELKEIDKKIEEILKE